jgi:predicted nucleic acid-binding protein
VTLRVAVDANVLIAGIIWPRWPYEVLMHAVRNEFALVLPELVIKEAHHRLLSDFPEFLPDFELLLKTIHSERIPIPLQEEIEENRELMRDLNAIPIALSVVKAGVDYFVTYDRDYTDAGRTTELVRAAIPGILLPPVFLRDVMGWTSEQLEQVRGRNWADLENLTSE